MLLTLMLTPWECSKSAQVLYLNHDHALQGQHRQADKCVMYFLNQCKHMMNCFSKSTGNIQKCINRHDLISSSVLVGFDPEKLL